MYVWGHFSIVIWAKENPQMRISLNLCGYIGCIWGPAELVGASNSALCSSAGTRTLNGEDMNLLSYQLLNTAKKWVYLMRHKE